MADPTPAALQGQGYVQTQDYDFGVNIRNRAELDVHFKTRYPQAGWTIDKLNDEWQRFRDNNNHVFVTAGTPGTNDPPRLDLVARIPSGGGLFDGGIESGMIACLAQQRGGVFEMRAKVPKKLGAWPAFWFIPAFPEPFCWPPELDMLEWPMNSVTPGTPDGPSNFFSGAIEGNGRPTGTGWTVTHFSLLDGFGSYHLPDVPGTTITPPSYVNAGTRASVATGATVTPALPGSRVNGNLLIAFFGWQSNSSITTPPSGWTQIAVRNRGDFVAVAYYRYVDGTEADPAIVWATSGSGGWGQVYQFTSVRSSSPIANANTIDIGAATGVTLSSFATSNDNSRVVYLAGMNGQGAIATPTDYTEHLDNNSATATTANSIGSRLIATAGASGAIGVATGFAASWMLFAFELRGAGGTGTVDADGTTDYHTWTVEWDYTTDRMKTYFDGLLIVDRTYPWKCNDGTRANDAMLLINLAVGGSWAGRNGVGPTTGDFPFTYSIDYLRIWQKQAAPPPVDPPPPPPPTTYDPTPSQSPGTILPVPQPLQTGFVLVKDYKFGVNIPNYTELRRHFQTRYPYANWTIDTLNDELERYRDNDNHRIITATSGGGTTGLTPSGARVSTANGQIFENLDITAPAGSHGITITHDDCVVRNVLVRRVGTQDDKHGVVFDGCDGGTVDRLRVLKTDKPATGQLQIMSGSGSCAGLLLIGCTGDFTIDKLNTNGVARGFYIFGSAMSSCDATNIQCDDIRATVGAPTGGAAIHLFQATNVTIEGVSSNNDRNASYTENNIIIVDSDNIIVRNGRIHGNNGPNGVGVTCTSTCTNVLVENIDFTEMCNGAAYCQTSNVTYNNLRARDQYGPTGLSRGNPNSGSGSAFGRLAFVGATFSSVNHTACKYFNWPGAKQLNSGDAGNVLTWTEENFTPQPLLNLTQMPGDSIGDVPHLDLVAHAPGGIVEDGIESGMVACLHQMNGGVFEMRAKVPRKLGAWPAFWIIPGPPDDGKMCWPPEVDVLEWPMNSLVIGTPDGPNNFFSAIKTGNGRPGGIDTVHFSALDVWGSYHLAAGVDGTFAYHTWTLHWNEVNDRFKLYYDGTLILDATYPWTCNDGTRANPATIIMNLAVGGAWAGANGVGPTLADFPFIFSIDYLRIWQRTTGGPGPGPGPGPGDPIPIEELPQPQVLVRPTLVTPTVIHLDDVPTTEDFTFDDDEDYIIYGESGGTGRTRPVRVIGGRNGYIIGGKYTTAITGSTNPGSTIAYFGGTGIHWVEGVHIDRSGTAANTALSKNGITWDEHPTRTDERPKIHMFNCRVEGITGNAATDHGDAIEGFAAYAEIRVEQCTFGSQYRGIYVPPLFSLPGALARRAAPVAPPEGGELILVGPMEDAPPTQTLPVPASSADGGRDLIPPPSEILPLRAGRPRMLAEPVKKESGQIVISGDGKVVQDYTKIVGGIRTTGTCNGLIIRRNRIEMPRGSTHGIDITGAAPGFLIEDTYVYIPDFVGRRLPREQRAIKVAAGSHNGTVRRFMCRNTGSMYFFRSNNLVVQDCEGYNMRCHEINTGGDARGYSGQFAQFNECLTPLFERFHTVTDLNVGSTVDCVSFHGANGAICRQGIIDGNTDPSGVGVMVEHQTTVEALIQDVTVLRMGNGGFACYDGSKALYERCQTKDHYHEPCKEPRINFNSTTGVASWTTDFNFASAQSPGVTAGTHFIGAPGTQTKFRSCKYGSGATGGAVSWSVGNGIIETGYTSTAFTTPSPYVTLTGFPFEANAAPPDIEPVVRDFYHVNTRITNPGLTHDFSWYFYDSKEQADALNSNAPETPVNLVDCWAQDTGVPTFTADTHVLRPRSIAAEGSSYGSTRSGNVIRWLYTNNRIAGEITIGIPPAGDFCKAEDVGIGYGLEEVDPTPSTYVRSAATNFLLVDSPIDRLLADDTGDALIIDAGRLNLGSYSVAAGTLGSNRLVDEMVTGRAFRSAGLTTNDAVYLVEFEAFQGFGEDVTPPYLVGGQPIASMPFGSKGSGGTINFRYSDRGWIGEPTDLDRANIPYWGRVVNPITFDRLGPILPEQDRRVQTQYGEIIIAGGDGLFDHALRAFAVNGRPVTVRRGRYLTPRHERFSAFTIVLSGLILNWEQDEDLIRITVRDRSIKLQNRLQLRNYQGTGSGEGTAEWKDRSMPLTLGRKLNVRPDRIGTTNNLFRWSSSPSNAVIEARDQGVTLILDQDYPTLAALNAATIATDGHFVTCLAESCLRTKLTPVDLTIDVEGDKTGGTFVNTHGGIAVRVMQTYAGLTENEYVGTSFGLWPPGVAGFHIPSGSDITCADFLNEIAASCSGSWGPQRDGRVRASRMHNPVGSQPVLNIQSKDVIGEVEALSTPTVPRWAQRVGYAALGAVQGAGELAASTVLVTAEDRAFYGSPFRVESRGDAAVKRRFLEALDPPVLVSAFVDAADAGALAQYILDIHKIERRMFRVTIGTEGYFVDLYSVVRFAYPRFGLSSGQNFIVVGINETSDTITLTLWG